MNTTFNYSHCAAIIQFLDSGRIVSSNSRSFHSLPPTYVATPRSSIRLVQTKDICRLVFLHGMDTYAEF